MLTQTLGGSSNSADNPNNDPVVLVCASDNNYAMPLAVTLRSVLENLSNNRKVSLFIIDGGIKQCNKDRIERSVNSNKVSSLSWLTPPENLLSDVKVSAYYTKAIFYRLLIPELLPNHRKAIYLDSDLIVVSDIGNLWDIDFEDNYLLAARDLYFPTILSASCKQLIEGENIRLQKFFNSGVMSINLEKWRSEQIGIKVINYISQHKLLDQEGLNIVLQNKWKEINPCWNQTWGIYKCKSWNETPFSEDEFRKLIEKPFIIHFTSENKPWNSTDYHPARQLYYQYLDMTEWKNWRFTLYKQFQYKISRKLSNVKKKLF